MATLDTYPANAGDLSMIKIDPLIGTDGAVDSSGTWSQNVITTALYNGYVGSDAVQNSYLAWDLFIPKGTWKLAVMGRTGGNRGILTVQFDGVSVGTFDYYTSGATAENVIKTQTGIVVAASKLVRVKAIIATKNASSSGYSMLVNSIVMNRTAR